MVSFTDVSLLSIEDPKTLRTQLEKQLKAELEGKAFANKIVLGSVFKYYDRTSRKAREDGVITEVYPTGDIRYCRDRWPGFLGLYDSRNVVNITELQDKQSIGNRMLVKKIKMKGDSVVLDLSNAFTGTQGWLKFVLGEKYETKYEFESIMIIISQALNIDIKRYELERKFKDLKSKLQYDKTSQGRLQIAQQLYEILAEILKQLETSGKGSPIYIQYQQQKANLETLIQTLQPQAQQERLAEIRQILKTQADEEIKTKEKLKITPIDLPKVEEQLTLLKQLEEFLQNRRRLCQEMATLGAPISSEESIDLEDSFRELNKSQKELIELQKKFKIQQLDNEYRTMKQRRMKLYDAYTQAFGTPREQEIKAQLLGHLQQMYENRSAAEQLGSKLAATEVAKLLEEIKKIQRQP